MGSKSHYLNTSLMACFRRGLCYTDDESKWSDDSRVRALACAALLLRAGADTELTRQMVRNE